MTPTTSPAVAAPVSPTRDRRRRRQRVDASVHARVRSWRGRMTADGRFLDHGDDRSGEKSTAEPNFIAQSVITHLNPNSEGCHSTKGIHLEFEPGWR